MSEGREPAVPRYLPKIIAKLAGVQLTPGLHHIIIRHDDWCDLLNRRGPCNCDPDVDLRLPGRN